MIKQTISYVNVQVLDGTDDLQFAENEKVPKTMIQRVAIVEEDTVLLDGVHASYTRADSE